MKLITDTQNWNQRVLSLPEPHFLQSNEWSQVKGQYGWTPHHLSWEADGEVKAAALVLERGVRPLPFLPAVRMLYAPKGPLLKNWDDAELRDEVLADMLAFALQRKAFLLKMDPDIILGTGIPGEDGVENQQGQAIADQLKNKGWRYAPQQIQFRNTAVLDLTPDEEKILADMKSKTRYNIRLAGRKGVHVRTCTPADFHKIYQLYAETSLRGGFVIRSEDYYQTVWQKFLEAGYLTPLAAEVEGEMTAALMLFHFGPTAYYFYGMSGHKHRNLMPAYALQWEAIQRAKALGCTNYDLWGAPDVFNESDDMWGVFRIKQGLGGKAVRTMGAYDYVLKPLQYWLYTTILPKVLDIMRRGGNAQTRQNIEEE